MPVNLVPDLGKGNVKVRFKERYVSEGINMRQFGLAPRGVIRGFEIVPSLGNWLVDVVIDGDLLDSVAVVELSTGVQVKVRLDASMLGVDLTALAGVRAVFVLRVDYVSGAETVLALDAYTEADYLAAADEFMCVLGEVDVPALAAPITEDMIGGLYRKWYFLGAPKGTEDYERYGIGRQRVGVQMGVLDTLAQDVFVFNPIGAGGEEVRSEVAHIIAGGIPWVEGNKVLHFDLAPVAAEKYAAFYMPIATRVPCVSGDRFILDLAVELTAVEFKAAWGGNDRLGVRFAYYDDSGVAVGSQEFDLRDYVLGPPYATVGFERFTVPYTAMAGCRYVSVYFEALGLWKKLGAVWGDSCVRIAFADVYRQRHDPAFGGVTDGIQNPKTFTSLYLAPLQELSALRRIYDDLPAGVPYPYVASLPLSGVSFRVEVCDSGAGVPASRLVVEGLNGDKYPGGMPALEFVSNLWTKIGGWGAGVGTVGQDLAYMAGGTGAGGEARVSCGGLGSVRVYTDDGELLIFTTGIGNLSLTTLKLLSLTGVIPDAGVDFAGTKVIGAACPNAVLLREEAGVPAVGGVFKRVDDIKACVPAEDILYEEWFNCITPAAFAVVPFYYFWIRFPYTYFTGGSPTNPANWYLPTAAEIDISASVKTANINVAEVTDVTEYGFTVRLAMDPTAVAGQPTTCQLKWKFVPA